MDSQPILLLIAVLLPPGSLDNLGPVVKEREVETPWGKVGPIACRRVEDERNVWIIPYSGSPTRTDPRATIWAVRALGIERILGWDTVVGLNPLLQRGDNVIISDTLDMSRDQPATIIEDSDSGWPAAVPFLCPEMEANLRHALPIAFQGAVYASTDRPRRETKAEARAYRIWGADVVGQNLVPEATFAWELGLCFTGLGTVTAVAADRPQTKPLGEAREATRQVIEALPAFLSTLMEAPTCACSHRKRE